MGLITHNRIYVYIDASPCPVIVDLVIIGFVGTVPEGGPSMVAAPASAAYARRRRPCKCQPCPWVATPTGNSPGRGWLPLAGGPGRSQPPLQGTWLQSTAPIEGPGRGQQPC
ncbi:hypothetical protein GW17_00051529 [Ensete ventricosum]|nr:hypothetical protein GW17_00051529 [Ensete ventricosum]